MKKTTYLLLAAVILASGGPAAYADAGAKKPHSKIRHAIHELTEAKTILAKIAPDADGHSRKAAQQVDMAIQELSQMKEAAPGVA